MPEMSQWHTMVFTVHLFIYICLFRYSFVHSFQPSVHSSKSFISSLSVVTPSHNHQYTILVTWLLQSCCW